MITAATLADLPAIEALANSAYRGESSKKGWTTEAHLLEGDLRTDAATLEAMLAAPGAVILKYENANGAIQGCVYLKKTPENKLYLGLLTVSPELQGGGIGKQLLAAADAYARQQQCRAIEMTVITVRHELIAWYQRHGYQPTGETRPFQVDVRFGRPTQNLEFVVLEKMVNKL